MSKNLTVTLSEEENEKLEKIVAFFQKRSISTVTRTDVIKYLISSSSNMLDSLGDNEELLNNITSFYETLGIKVEIDNISTNSK